MKTALAPVICCALYWVSIASSPAPSGRKLSAGPMPGFPVPDIHYTEEQLRLLNDPDSDKAATTNLTERWPGATVYYTIGPNITTSKRRTMFEGWQWIADNTCITFQRRTNQRDYVYVTYRENGWWSKLGRIGGRQEMNLGDGLYAGTAAHEMMHALGISHEHQRFDRNDKIDIDWQALKAIDTREKNWTAQYLINSQRISNNYGVPYNYESIMHYPANSPDGGNRQVIYAKEEGMDSVMGQREGLADTDIQLINTIYRCQ